MEIIDHRYIKARRQHACFEDPHLDYPSYVRKGHVSEVHDLADDDHLPITGPVDPIKHPGYGWDTAIYVACVAAMICLLFIEV